jgi:hypothetical protein
VAYTEQGKVTQGEAVCHQQSDWASFQYWATQDQDLILQG